MSGWKLVTALFWASVFSCLSVPIEAQLSPGDLASVHAQIDSNRACLECHRPGQGVDPQRCLSCHQPLAERIAAGTGLHARAEFDRCERCHIDHHGRNFELIWWGESGIAGFDHREAGWTLDGAHEDVDCRQCHRADLVVDAHDLVTFGKDLDRTFLGLSSNCRSCHADPHEAQFDPRSCDQCHQTEMWSATPGFDHQQTAFPLIGQHQSVDCHDCHVGDEEEAFIKYAGTSTRCVDCHRDVHEARLGEECSQCHSPTDWQAWDRDRFDHSLTRFALLGRHRDLGCASCHQPGEGFSLPRFESCSSCHQDVHEGRFQNRFADVRSDCSSCHSTERFAPSTFDADDHQLTGFELTGAHFEASCESCHQSVSADADAPSAKVAALDFEFDLEFAGCDSCHSNPHGAERTTSPACDDCHQTSTWRQVNYDHAETSFPLEGTHRTVECVACHRSTSLEQPDVISFLGAPTACGDCHADPHRGQFEESAPTQSCESCHSFEGWIPSLVEHTSYPLEGAHRRTPCRSCHLPDEQGFVRYRPLPRHCSGCHGDGAG